MAGLQKVEEEKEQAREEAAATAEIPQEPAGTTVEEIPATEEEPVKPATEIPHIDTGKNFRNVFPEVFRRFFPALTVPRQ